MNPRSFLNFFRTRSGKLTLFAAIFFGALFLFGHFRSRRGAPAEAVSTAPSDLDLGTNKSQVVQTVTKPMETFHPPPLKVENSATAAAPILSPARAEQVAANPDSAFTLPPLDLFPEAPALEPKTLSPNFSPFGRLIPCQTVITIDSASIQTPIIGLITENIYHAGRLVIPAGTEVHGSAQPDRSRERIASGTTWRLIWQTGEELSLKAIALDREFDNSTNQTGWGITDGSAGIRGRLMKSDNLAEIKLFAATFLSGAAGALTEKEPTIFGTQDTPSLNNAPFKGAQQVLSTYAQRIQESIQRDGFYVRIPSGKQFYLYVIQTIDRADAHAGGGEEAFAAEKAGAKNP